MTADREREDACGLIVDLQAHTKALEQQWHRRVETSMKHDDRVRRLNILLAGLPIQAEIGDTDALLDLWERALVLATVEITGLTEHIAAELSWREPEHERRAALRRYAELAK